MWYIDMFWRRYMLLKRVPNVWLACYIGTSSLFVYLFIYLLSSPGDIFFIAFFKRKRKTSIGCLPYAPKLGIKPATQVCALTGNWTLYLSVMGWCSNQLSHTSLGRNFIFHIKISFTANKRAIYLVRFYGMWLKILGNHYIIQKRSWLKKYWN